MPTSSSPKRISVLGVESVIVGHDMTALIAQEIVQSSNNGSVAAYIVITDSNIERLGHLSDLVCHLERTLKAAATTTTTSRILTFVLPPGEAIKTRQVKDQVENWMLANKCTRDSCLIALGGGVVGDMMGNLRF